MYDFAVDCDGIDISGVTDIHKYLMKSYKIAQILRFIKQAFIVLLCSGGSLSVKYESVNS